MANDVRMAKKTQNLGSPVPNLPLIVLFASAFLLFYLLAWPNTRLFLCITLALLMSRKLICTESDDVVSSIVSTISNDEDWQTTSTDSVTALNAETEKVIPEVQDRGKPISELQAPEAAETSINPSKDESSSADPPPYKTTELKVHLHCEGCKRKIVNTLCRIEGVKKLEVSMRRHKIVVSGDVDPMELLKKIRRAGKNAELWPEVSEEGKCEPEHVEVPAQDQISTPAAEAVVHHSERLAPDSCRLCIREPQYHWIDRAGKTEPKPMEECPVEPLAAEDSDDIGPSMFKAEKPANGSVPLTYRTKKEVPAILGTVNLKKHTYLEAEINPFNTGTHDSFPDHSALLQHPQLMRRARSKGVRPLLHALNGAGKQTYDVYENLEPQTKETGRFRETTGHLDAFNPSADRKFKDHSVMHKSQKEDLDETLGAEISDASDVDDQLYALVRTKKGLVKFVPVESQSTFPAFAGELPLDYENKMSKSSKSAKSVSFQSSNAKHCFDDDSDCRSCKVDPHHAISSRYSPHSVKTVYRSERA